MKKLLTILLLMIMIIPAITSQENLTEEQIKRQLQINNYTQTFMLERITYQGKEGYFIPTEGYKILRNTLLNYIVLQEIDLIKDERINKLEKYAILNFRLKTALGITIGIDVGTILLGISGIMLSYNIGLMQK